MRTFILNIKRFLEIEIWKISVHELPSLKAFFIRYLRILIVTIERFWKEKVYLRASALTFYSLLSIVPVFAMVFGIAKGFGFERILEQQIRDQFFRELPPDVINRIITSANNLLTTTRGSMIAGIGLIALFWTIIRVIGNIELAFNEIWGIKKQRPFGRKFSDYLSAMLICPVLLIISSSITVFIKTQVAHIANKIALLGYFSSIIFFALKFFPLFVLWGLFTFLYMLLPNTNVKFTSGLFAGIIAGTIYQLAQWAYITFQIGVAKYNAIYGSFAALPLFLIWLQISWIIVLLGAEFSYAHQNIEMFEFEPDMRDITPYGWTVLSIAVIKKIAKNFCEGKSPLTEAQICDSLKIPRSIISKILEDLVNMNLLCIIKTDDNQEKAFQPSIDPHSLTISKTIDILMGQKNEISVGNKDEIGRISTLLKDLMDVIQNSSKNKLIIDLD